MLSTTHGNKPTNISTPTTAAEYPNKRHHHRAQIAEVCLRRPRKHGATTVVPQIIGRQGLKTRHVEDLPCLQLKHACMAHCASFVLPAFTAFRLKWERSSEQLKLASKRAECKLAGIICSSLQLMFCFREGRDSKYSRYSVHRTRSALIGVDEGFNSRSDIKKAMLAAQHTPVIALHKLPEAW